MRRAARWKWARGPRQLWIYRSKNLGSQHKGTKTQRHQDTKAPRKPASKKPAFLVPLCLGVFVLTTTLHDAVEPFLGLNFETFDSSWNSFFSASVSCFGRTI